MPAALLDQGGWNIQEPRERFEDVGYLQIIDEFVKSCGIPKIYSDAKTRDLDAVKQWTIILSDSESREVRFKTLADEWRQGVKVQSSLAKISFHPAYQAILAMGTDALPFIMQDLNVRLDHWFYALRLITQEDVARGATTLEEARQKWLAWGKENQYLK